MNGLGARLRSWSYRFNVAEVRDQGKDVLLFIDNIFRFTQAGASICPAGRLPLLAHRLRQSDLPCGAVLVLKPALSHRSGLFALSADDLTDPAGGWSQQFNNLLARSALTELGLPYPAV